MAQHPKDMRDALITVLDFVEGKNLAPHGDIAKAAAKLRGLIATKQALGTGCMYDHDHGKGGCEYHD